MKKNDELNKLMNEIQEIKNEKKYQTRKN